MAPGVYLGLNEWLLFLARGHCWCEKRPVDFLLLGIRLPSSGGTAESQYQRLLCDTKQFHFHGLRRIRHFSPRNVKTHYRENTSLSSRRQKSWGIKGEKVPRGWLSRSRLGTGREDGSLEKQRELCQHFEDARASWARLGEGSCG